jgi:hypothetical protein
MTSRFIRGRRARGLKPGDDQVVTTTYETEADGKVREHVTLETPKALTETQRLRLIQTWEGEREYPT